MDDEQLITRDNYKILSFGEEDWFGRGKETFVKIQGDLRNSHVTITAGYLNSNDYLNFSSANPPE